MQQSLSDIALVLFTRTPEEEVRAKPLVPQGNHWQQIKVADRLIRHGREILAATGLPYTVYSSAEQKGKSFGERLQNAFAHLFAKGYKQVILIGNDCPQLTPSDILIAAQKLQKQDVVLGPDTRGGVYLLGLTQQAFTDKFSAKEIRWNTGWVLTDLVKLFKISPADVNILPPYADINNRCEFAKALRFKIFKSGLLHFFRQLLGLHTYLVNWPVKNLLLTFLLRGIPFRGPPALN